MKLKERNEQRKKDRKTEQEKTDRQTRIESLCGSFEQVEPVEPVDHIHRRKREIHL